MPSLEDKKPRSLILIRLYILCQFIVFLLIAFSAYGTPLQVKTKASSAILMNAETGAILYEKQCHTPSYPASTTKIATALYLLDEKRIDPGQMATVSLEALRLASDATLMYLVPGERISIDSLLHGLMLISGNDAANVLAEACSGSVPAFMEELNAYLKQLGCRDTHFKNPHGYHHPEHISTAYDLAHMTRQALRNAKFREIVSKQTYHKPKTNKQGASEIKQWNGLIREGKHRYAKAIGVKTGFHSFAQNNLVAAAEDQGRRLIAVVLGCPNNQDRYNDAKTLFEAAFAEKQRERILAPAGQAYIKNLEGAKTRLLAVLSKPLAISFFPAEEPHVKAFIHWDDIAPPIRKGARVGEIRVVDERVVDEQGALLAKEELTAQEAVSATVLFFLKQKWKQLF